MTKKKEKKGTEPGIFVVHRDRAGDRPSKELPKSHCSDFGRGWGGYQDER